MLVWQRIRRLMICISVVVFIYFAHELYILWAELQINDEVNQEIFEKGVTIADGTTPEAAEGQQATEKEGVPLTVDFDLLQEEYEDIVAWIYCEDTQINYPVMQSEDNSYYLDKMPSGQSNAAGSIFMDCRNNADFSDYNTILYGHNMKNGSMFGTLDEFKSQDYYNEHPVMYLLTPTKDYRVDLISGFITAADSNVYSFVVSDGQKKLFLETAKGKSLFSSSVTATEDACFLTLSTCSYEYDNARFVLIGKLVEIRGAEDRG